MTMRVAPTFCAIAGIDAPEWMQGDALPTASGSSRERIICEWDITYGCLECARLFRQN